MVNFVGNYINFFIYIMDDKQLITNENSLKEINSSLGMEGVVGYSMGDLPMPYLRLIQANTKPENKKMDNGEDAKAGQIMHSLTQETYDSLDVVVIAVKGGDKQMVERNGEMVEQGVDKLIVTQTGNPQPLMLFASTASQGAWRSYLGKLHSKGMKPYEVVTKISSTDYTNQKGQTWKIFNFELGAESSKEDRAIAEELLSRMNLSVFSRGETDEPELLPSDYVDVNSK